ncbi:ExbD/TolR family protein [Nitrosophilus kaiyonis]|uniref:ExbD/TolR family protein n=1 Tax=Nitrosophilus kaiyonis TaxID=2930200 RepID=UPI00248FAEF6|nr:biopolymer transporter ExbD [Nitrosophilus kaiyonis]
MFDWEEKPELNITPLVDVMLVLLAILMVTTPALIYEELIELPKGSKTKVLQKSETIEIRVDKNKIIYIKKDRYNYSNFADNFILLAQKYDKNSPVYIRADKRLSYGDVMYILKTVKEAGFAKVSLVTDG